MTKQRVNFNKDVQMHFACSNTDYNQCLQYIYFKNGFAYASNGRILVRNELTACSSLEEEQIKLLDGKLLHNSHYKEILKYDLIEISEEGIQGTKNGQKVFFYFNTTEKYVNAEKTLNEQLNKTTVSTSQFGLNIELLSLLKKALCTNGDIKFTNKGKYNAMICENMHSDYLNCIGIIMPLAYDM